MSQAFGLAAIWAFLDCTHTKDNATALEWELETDQACGRPEACAIKNTEAPDDSGSLHEVHEDRVAVAACRELRLVHTSAPFEASLQENCGVESDTEVEPAFGDIEKAARAEDADVTAPSSSAAPDLEEEFEVRAIQTDFSIAEIRRTVMFQLNRMGRSKSWKAAGERLPLAVLAVVVSSGTVVAISRLITLIQRHGPVQLCDADLSPDLLAFQHLWVIAPAVSMLVVAGCTALLVATAVTRSVFNLSIFATVNWGAHTCVWLTSQALCDPDLNSVLLPAHVSERIGLVLNMLLPAMALRSVLERLAEVEKVFSESLGSQGLQQVVLLLLPVMVAMVATSLVFSAESVLFGVVLHVFILWSAAGNIFAIRCLIETSRRARASGPTEGNGNRALLPRRAVQDLRLQISGTIAAACTTGLHTVTAVLLKDWLWPLRPPDAGTTAMQALLVVENLAEILHAVGNAYLAMTLSGMLSGDSTQQRKLDTQKGHRKTGGSTKSSKGRKNFG